MAKKIINCVAGLLLLMTSPLVGAVVVVMDPDSSFTDVIGSDVWIGMDMRGKGPLIGHNFVFACGAPGEADLSMTYPQTGGRAAYSSLCGFEHQSMKTILWDDIILTGIDQVTGGLYAIDLLAFRGVDRCYDNDAGVTCDATDGFTAYERNLVPLPATVWLFGCALGLLGWMRLRVV